MRIEAHVDGEMKHSWLYDDSFIQENAEEWEDIAQLREELIREITATLLQMVDPVLRDKSENVQYYLRFESKMNNPDFKLA